MQGFKGFDKDLKCRGMQYALGVAQVGRKHIKADTFYSLKDGKFVEVSA